MTTGISPQDLSLNIHSPYYLHPGENPTNALVSAVLDPTNYNSWFEKFVKDLKDEEKYFWKDRYFMDMGLYPKTHLPSSYHGC